MRALCTVLLLASFSSVCLAQGNTPDRTLKNDHWDFISANRMLLWFSNNGALAHNPTSSGSGLEWPVGSGNKLVFMSGVVHGARLFDTPHVGGSTYNHGWQAGVIRADGIADDPQHPLHRIFRARRFDPVWWNAQSLATRTYLLRDLAEWPVQFGAPWVDANGNGIYDPDTTAWQLGGNSDGPLLNGDEAFWFAGNDLDSRRTINLYGDMPLGLEMHTHIWASSGHPVLENVIFREHTYFQKSTDSFPDMYLGAWEDPDLGDAFDDFVGVDTSLGLMFTYNGRSRDGELGLPPQSGTVWLQTPVKPAAGHTARYGNELRNGYANLPLSGYTFYIGGSSVYRDAALKEPAGRDQMYHNLSGKLWNGQSMIDPVRQRATPLALSGDPVLRHGWVDGIVHAPGDRRAISSSGPFEFAVGDTQKVLFAHIAAQGGNSLLSVRALRNLTRQLHDINRNLPRGVMPPVFSSSISFTATPGDYEVNVSGGPFHSGTLEVAALLRAPDGADVARTPLNDNGVDGDQTAGDGIYGGSFNGVSPVASGADLFVLSKDAEGEKQWFVESEIPTSGEVRVRIAEIVSDSRNFDGQANPGENLRLRLRFDNLSADTLGGWHLFLRDSTSMYAEWTVLRHDEHIPPGEFSETTYDAADRNSYLSITIPADAVGGTELLFPVTLISDNYQHWTDVLRIEVVDYDVPDLHGLLAHVEGHAVGSLGYSVMDPAALTLHDYRVSVEGEDFGTKTLWVENVTLGTTLHRGLPLPDKWVHDSPTIDGWRLSMGTAFDELVFDSQGQKLDSFRKTVVGAFTEPSRAWFRADAEQLMIGKEFWNSKLNLYDVLPVKLVFDRNNGQKALGYMRGTVPNYRFQGYFDVPLRAYDMSDTSNPRQIMLGFSEQVNRPSADSTWWPTDRPDDREFLLIYADDYAETPDKKFQGQAYADAVNLDLLYVLHGFREANMPMFEDGDEYHIIAPVPVSNRDVYILAKPRLLDIRSEATRPSAIALHQNYPNPFGPGSASGGNSTTISFDLPREMHARVTVFDLLGRRVAMVLDRAMSAGTHRVRFDAASLRNGTYLLCLDADGRRESRTVLVLR
ncbi:MAG: T9SS type A sorting domain-containing protein [Bacteroidia bacterium]|nr:T9SS type A sorting domain-containing protein [Bacteroidia bacterium]